MVAQRRSDFDVIIIGTGIGGTAAGAVLAHAGKRVLLLDKNPRYGGSCSYYDKQGFRIDMGTHLFCRGEKGPLGEVLRRTGRPGAIWFKRALPLKARGSGLWLHLARNPAAWPLGALDALRQTGIPLAELPKVARFFYAILRMPMREIEALDDTSVHDFVLRYTQNPYVYLAFNFLLGLYFILPPKDVSAGEAIYCFQVMARDFALSYPKGGAAAIPGAYIRIAETYGAELRLRAGVKKIIIEKGCAAGVELESGEVVRARTIVSTTSLKDVVYRLTGAGHFSAAFRRRVDGLVGSQIAVQAKIGLRRPLVNAAVLIGGTPMAFPPGLPDIALLERNFETFFRGRVPEMTPIYCPIPTFFDPSLAPPGHQLLTACALAPTTDVPLSDGAERWTEAMMSALRQMVPGLEREAVFIDTFSVRFMEHWIGKSGGSAITTAQTMGQVGDKRPGVRSEIPGLYFAGCCAGGRGVGTELAATSGMECADAILAAQPRKAPRKRRAA